MTLPVLSIIVGTMDRPEPFARMLASVTAYTDVAWEMIVGDASERPGYVDRVTDARVRIVQERPRAGHVAGYNRCFRFATAPWVCWLNDDVEVLAGWATAAIAWMERNASVGLGCMAYDEGNDRDRIQTYHGMHYANFGILRREVGARVGWFDEACWMYAGDNSLAFRVLLEGRGVAPIRPARIVHHVEYDAQRRSNAMRQHADIESLLRRYAWQIPKMKTIHDEHLARVVN